MRITVIIACVLTGFFSMAQKFPFYKNYEWEEHPRSNKMQLKNELYHYTKYLLAVEYEYDYTDENYYKYETENYRVKLSSDAAIEEFNKVYIPMEGAVRIKKLQARVIKDQEVIQLAPEVEEFYSEDEDERYFYFPVSRIELGDEIEILYTVQKLPDFDGDQFFFQSDIPIYDFDFHFIAPADSYFQFLAHNGLKEPELVDSITKKNQWSIHMDSIPAYEPEYFSEYNNTAMKLDVALRGFDTPDDRSYSPYNSFNKLLNPLYNVAYSRREMKFLEELNEEIGIHLIADKEEQIRRIEHFMKTEMFISGSVPDDDLVTVIKNKRANSISCIQLYMGLFRTAEIEFEYGFISDRYDTKLSDEIESMYFLQNYFLYFPKIDKYLAPLDFSTRLGYLDANWIPNNGYFLKQKRYPEPSTDWEIRPVEGTSAYDNTDSIIIRITVDDEMLNGDVSVERHVKGYKAGKYQTYYHLYSDHKRKEQHNDLLNFFQDNSVFKMTEIENVDPEDAFTKPLIIKGEMIEAYQPFIEKAGDRTIFKLGHLFNDHLSAEELETKQTDFVFANPMIRTYIIEVNFPEGAEVKNLNNLFQTDDFCDLEDINMISSIEWKDNQLRFTSREEYLSHRYKIEDKEEVIKAFDYYDQLTKMNLILK